MNFLHIEAHGLKTTLNLDLIREIRVGKHNDLFITWMNGEEQKFIEPEIAQLVYEKVKNLSMLLVREKLQRNDYPF